MSNKPAFKLSVSMLNKYLYYREKPYDSNFKSLVEALDGVWEDNFWTLRGKKYEDEVFQGNHGEISELVKDLKIQVWAKKTLNMGNFDIIFNGKIDAYDSERSRIYDIKRVDRFSEDKYDDSLTCQHRIYQWLFDNKIDFYYIVAEGVGDIVSGHHVVYKEKVTDEILETSIRSLVKEFLEFLYKKGLLEKFQNSSAVV